MRLLFVADGRSPIALNWIQFFVDLGHEVHLASTFPCSPELKLASLHFIPVAFSSAVGEPISQKKRGGIVRKWTTPRLRTAIRQWLGPLTIRRAGRKLQGLIKTLQPALVHAMRIPYEGMIATLALGNSQTLPLLISVWGNDFTLHANSTPLMARFTRQALQCASALHTDCYRDLRLAHEWGFSRMKPDITVPGNGGIDLKVFFPSPRFTMRGEAFPEPTDISPIVIQPRGFRAYVRNDTFFKAIPLVLQKYPRTRFVLPSMAGDSQIAPYQTWLHTKNLDHAVEFLPHLPRTEMAQYFQQADIAVSPSEHDGTPNTLLEAMACGCLPIAGDIESLREWITPGENGLLFNPSNHQLLADAILRGIEDTNLRQRAAKENARLIADRAEYHNTMSKVEQFYATLLRPLSQENLPDQRQP